MKTIVLLPMLVCLHMPAVAKEPVEPFKLLDLYIGQPVADAVKRYPAMECENSCFLEGYEFFAKQGKLWAGVKNDRISQLAFRFSPALTSSDTEQVRAGYINKHGQASDHLGDGCDEWEANGGYLAICLSTELSHVWWSTESSVDINIQNQRKRK